VISPASVAIYLLLVVLTMAPAFADNDRSSDSTGHLARGLDLASKKYPEEAAAEFDRCRDLAPATAHQLAVMAKSYFEAGKIPSSLRIIEYALLQERVKEHKSDMAYLLEIRGDVFSSEGRRDEAVASYELAATTDPADSYIFSPKAGRELMKSNRFKEALPLLRKGIKSGEMNGIAYQNIGRCYLQMKNPAQAISPLIASIDNFEAYRKHEKDAFMPRLAQSYKDLIQAYEDTGNKKEALVWQKRQNALVGDLDLDLFGKP
jgi:tetratricopeptide (TPR) repeat protein